MYDRSIPYRQLGQEAFPWSVVVVVPDLGVEPLIGQATELSDQRLPLVYLDPIERSMPVADIYRGARVDYSVREVRLQAATSSTHMWPSLVASPGAIDSNSSTSIWKC